MARELVPELHDIGKLTDQWRVGEGHQFESFDFSKLGSSPDSPTWQGILRHHAGDRPMHPTSPETLVCCIADNLASAASRGKQPSREEKRVISHAVWKVWGPPAAGDFPLISSEEAATFVRGDPDAGAYFQKYGALLLGRAEETRRPVTSLFTHSELTGKFYRLLSGAFRLAPEEVKPRDGEEAGRLVQRKQDEWRLTVAICRPHLMIKPFRARDLGVFALLGEAMDEVRTRFPDNALLVTPERLLAVAPSPVAIDQIIETFTRRGFWLEVVQAARTLNEFDQYDLVDTLDRRPQRMSRFPDLLEEIPPPICEACRMAPASKKWRGDEDDLCDACFAAREAGASLGNLARWEMETVAWVRIGLDLERLVRACRDLYAAYLESNGTPGILAEVRFSLLAEFARDYDAFLQRLRADLFSGFGAPNVEYLLAGLWCIKLRSRKDLINILGVFNRAIGEFFPKFRGLGRSPVSIGVSSSAAKYPFFEHSRLLEDQQEDVVLHLVGQGAMRAALRALPEVLAVAAMPNRSALHNLAEVARISEQLARLKLQDREDSDLPSYRGLRQRLLPFGLDYQSILTLARVVGG